MNKHSRRALALLLPVTLAACAGPGAPTPQASDPPPGDITQGKGATAPVPDGTVIGGAIVSGSVESCGTAGAARPVDRALLVDPGDPSRVWLGVENLGLFRSTDGGTSWSWAVRGLKAHVVGSGRDLCFDRFTTIVMDPFDFHHVCVGLAGRSGSTGDPMAGANGVFCSRNDGADWQQVVGSGMNTAVTALAIDGSQQLWAGTAGLPDVGGAYHNAGGVLYTSVDDGTSWVEMNFGMGFVPGMVLRDFQISPTSPQILYAAAPVSAEYAPVGSPPQQYGVLVSADSGASWGSLTGGMGTGSSARAITRIALAPGGARMLAATAAVPPEPGPYFYFTDVTGAGFHEPLLPANLALDVFAFDPGDRTGSHALGLHSRSRDLWESFDGGESWHSFGAQLPDETAGNPVVVSHIQWSGDGRVIYLAGSDAAVYRSDDVGRTWAKVFSSSRIPSGKPQ